MSFVFHFIFAMIQHILQRLARNPFCCLLNENTCVGFALTGTRAETCPEHAAFVADYVSSKHENILCHRNTLVTGALYCI